MQEQEKRGGVRTVAAFLVAALVVGGLAVGANSLRCLRRVDGEAVGGSSVRTFGEYEQGVDAASGGCTDVILLDTNGEIVDNPDPNTRIQPITGRSLHQPITVQEVGVEQTPGDVQHYFESGPWQISEPPDSDTTPIDERVSFDSSGTPVVAYQSLSCGRSASAIFGWTSEGFMLDGTDDEPIALGTDPNCNQLDDLQVRFLTRGFDGDHIDAEIRNDGSTAVLTRGDLQLTLVRITD